MVEALHLYVDDSGSRHPSRDGQNMSDCFALGGILVREGDEAELKAAIEVFRQQWSTHLPLHVPLHSYEIRRNRGPFAWLRARPDQCAPFLEGLAKLLASAPIVCTACVIDRAGYAARYFQKYEPSKRWMLCKTAFSVLLERAVKYSAQEGKKLRVYVERSDKDTDRTLKGYYDSLRANGMPFDPSSMASYVPLPAEMFKSTLYDFRMKDKTSALMQLADLTLYPMCRGGYDKRGRDYRNLVQHGKLIDTILPPEDVPRLGVKYSCFESVQVKYSDSTRPTAQ
jgi:hypothetical protein